MGLDHDGPAPRQITRGSCLQEESTDPIYLPSGRIAFMSPRAGGLVQCGDWAWADCMYTMNPDGTDVRQIKRGERMGCVGCHEPAHTAPPGRSATFAARRGPSEIEPPPWGIQTFGFPKLVQPILDGHCVQCHDGAEGKEKAFDLRAGSDEAEAFVPDVYTITDVGYKACYTYQSYWALQPYIKAAHIHQYLTPPGTWGARVSPLMQQLAKGHQQVRLSPTEWRILCVWIDCNLPYLDDWRKYAVDLNLRQQAKRP